jgi:hypothetical protein
VKVTLDLTALLAESKITQAEYDRFSQYAAVGTGSLAFNILIGFGVVAVGGGLIALVPNPTTGIVLGVAFLAAGLWLYYTSNRAWEVLAHICVLVGALMLAGGIILLGLGSVTSFLIVAIGFAVVGALARSSLLIALSILALSSCIGARTDYFEATYFLGIEAPTATVVLFALIALGAYQASKRLPADYEPLAIAAARTSIFMVNFGFWIGSLFGDENPDWHLAIPDWAFVIGWAVALVGAGAWAARANRRWLVNVAAVFAAIHFYTQWFERLGVDPLAVVVAGVVALGIAVALWRFNRDLFATRRPAVAG